MTLLQHLITLKYFLFGAMWRIDIVLMFPEGSTTDYCTQYTGIHDTRNKVIYFQNQSIVSFIVQGQLWLDHTYLSVLPADQVTTSTPSSGVVSVHISLPTSNGRSYSSNTSATKSPSGSDLLICTKYCWEMMEMSVQSVEKVVSEPWYDGCAGYTLLILS